MFDIDCPMPLRHNKIYWPNERHYAWEGSANP
jgi:hypothetical protein